MDKRFVLLAMGWLAAATPGAANEKYSVLDCALEPNGPDIVSARASLYLEDGEPHSAFFELTMDYGDTLPYVFECSESCIMDLSEDEYTYTLTASPGFAEPESLSLLTRDQTRDEAFQDMFSVEACSVR